MPVLKSIISAAANGEAVSSLMNKQIADELPIGEATVKMHRISTMRQLSPKAVARLDFQNSKHCERKLKRY